MSAKPLHSIPLTQVVGGKKLFMLITRMCPVQFATKCTVVVSFVMVFRLLTTPKKINEPKWSGTTFVLLSISPEIILVRYLQLAKP